MKFIKEVNQNDWILHLEPPMETPEKVIRYIGRYSKRACISEHKITNIEGEFISFKHKDNKDRDENNVPKEKILELHYSDFFPRLLQHVPLPYFKLVRYYGIYSNRGNIPQEYFYKKESIEVEEIVIDNPKECKECGIAKIYIYTIFDIRGIKERNTPFNINLHKHLITERNYKQFAA